MLDFKSDKPFDDFLVATVLADLFDETDSIDTLFLSKKIVDGLEKYGLIICNDKENDYFDDNAAA